MEISCFAVVPSCTDKSSCFLPNIPIELILTRYSGSLHKSLEVNKFEFFSVGHSNRTGDMKTTSPFPAHLQNICFMVSPPESNIVPTAAR